MPFTISACASLAVISDGPSVACPPLSNHRPRISMMTWPASPACGRSHNVTYWPCPADRFGSDGIVTVVWSPKLGTACDTMNDTNPEQSARNPASIPDVCTLCEYVIPAALAAVAAASIFSAPAGPVVGCVARVLAELELEPEL